MTKTNESTNERTVQPQAQPRIVVARFAFAVKEWAAEMRLTRGDVERVERLCGS